MTCVHLVLSFSLISAALIVQSRADVACSSITSVFNHTDPESNPPGELSAHTLLWFNNAEGAVHLSVSFLNVQLPTNTNYTLTVVGPSTNFSLPVSGGNFSVQMPSNGTGSVRLDLHYNTTTAAVDGGTVAFVWDLNVLYVPFIEGVPSVHFVSAGPSTADYTCGGAGTAHASFGADGSLDLAECQCCDLGTTVHADILTCPAVNVVTTATTTNTTDGGDNDGGNGDNDGGNGGNSTSFLGYLLSLCVAVLLFVGLY